MRTGGEREVDVPPRDSDFRSRRSRSWLGALGEAATFGMDIPVQNIQSVGMDIPARNIQPVEIFQHETFSQ
jgi:hypothetical protein